jgi:hypothetical protein
MRRALALFGVLLGLAIPGCADIVPAYQVAVPSATNPGAWTHIYTAELSASERLDDSGVWDHFFVIYDFAGYIGGSILSSNPDFMASTAMVGPYADDLGAPIVPPTDDPGIPNLVFTWTGAGVVGGGAPVLLGVFQADSIYFNTVLDRYQGQATKHNPLAPMEDGTRTGNTGQVLVPQIPEPASMALVGSALIYLAMLRRSRRRQRM